MCVWLTQDMGQRCVKKKKKKGSESATCSSPYSMYPKYGLIIFQIWNLRQKGVLTPAACMFLLEDPFNLGRILPHGQTVLFMYCVQHCVLSSKQEMGPPNNANA